MEISWRNWKIQWNLHTNGVIPKINKCKEILEEIEKSNDIYIQMEPPNNLIV